jgi:hypothetical protein
LFKIASQQIVAQQVISAGPNGLIRSYNVISTSKPIGNVGEVYPFPSAALLLDEAINCSSTPRLFFIALQKLLSSALRPLPIIAC